MPTRLSLKPRVLFDEVNARAHRPLPAAETQVLERPDQEPDLLPGLWRSED